MGDLRIWFSLIAVIAVWSLAPSAQAGGLAIPGEVYATATLDNPAGSLPGGDSGYGTEPTSNEVSQDGRYVVFTSKANSMAPGTNPNSVNVYRKDRQTGAVELASRATGVNGDGGKGNSYEPRISDDGNIVGFISRADIDPTDTDGGESDIYIRDIAAGTTKLMTGGIPSDFYQFDLSGDGQYIAFVTSAVLVGTDTNSNPDVFRRKISDGSTALASRIIASETAVNGSSLYPALSNDGRWVAFTSTAPDVIAGFVDSNTGSSDVFVRDMNGGAGSNRLVSCKFNSAVTGGNAGSAEPDIAGTPGIIGEVKVAYSSNATDTVAPGLDLSNNSSVFLKNFTGISSTLLSITSLGANANSRAHTPSISDDATRIAFSSDATNLSPGAEYYGSYLRNTTAGTTTLVSNSTQYAVYGVLSGNGNYVVWDEQGGFTPDSDPDSFGVFGRSVPDGSAEFISRPPGNQPFLKTAASVSTPSSRAHVLSADGRYFVFEGGSHRLPGGADTEFGQIYRRDLLTGAVELLSRRTGANGALSTGSASSPSISADGNRVAFISYAPLSDDDTNTYGDVYVRDIGAQTTTLASRGDGPTGAVSTDGAGSPVLSADGSRVVFGSSSSNLGLGAGFSQIYVRDLNTNATVPVSRADGAAGAAGSSNSLEPGISGDGNLVVFASAAVNLNPDDVLVDRDIFVRNLANNTTILVSRAPGLTGTKLAEYEYSQTISSDGSTVAFETSENIAVPGGTPWPVGPRQIVLRKLATGENTLASEVGGVPSETAVTDVTMNRDASVVAFRADSKNLLPAVGNGDNDYVAVKRMNDGQLSGPPLFGDPLIDTQTGSRSPSLSDNGQCLAFRATGYNEISGNASDYNTSYMQVLSGTCFNPRAVVPALSKLSLKPKKFAVAKKPTAKVAAKKKGKKKSPKGTKIRFTLNRDADVAFTIEKRTVGRKVKGKCVKAKKGRKVPKKKRCARWVPAGKLTRASQPAGARTLYFSGRIGKKKLRPGGYRVALQATATSGTSPVSKPLPFTVLRK